MLGTNVDMTHYITIDGNEHRPDLNVVEHSNPMQFGLQIDDCEHTGYSIQTGVCKKCWIFY